MRKLSLFITAAVLQVSTAFGNVPADAFVKSPTKVTQAELNAISILSSQAPTGIYFSKSQVAQIASEIRKIKRAFPEVRKINAYGAHQSLYTVALMNFTDAAMVELSPLLISAASLPPVVDKYVSGDIETTALLSGVSDFAKLQTLVPVKSSSAHYSVSQKTPFNVTYFMVEFDALVNIQGLAQALQPYTELRYIEPNGLVGDGNQIIRRVGTDGSVKYTFSIGDGDCPSGCTEWTNYHFEIGVDGKVSRAGEDGGRP